MIQIVITDFIMEEIVGLLDCWSRWPNGKSNDP